MYYELLHISWKEMQQFMSGELGDVQSSPAYYATDPNGSLRIWPKFETAQMVLMFKYKGKR
jgi:hypothetical protein